MCDALNREALTFTNVLMIITILWERVLAVLVCCDPGCRGQQRNDTWKLNTVRFVASSSRMLRQMRESEQDKNTGNSVAIKG